MKTSTFLKRSVIIGALAAAAIGSSALAQEDRPYLGVTFTGVETGVRVTGVLPGSPADSADVELGDIVTAINGDTITAETITDVLDDYDAGETITLTLERDGAPLELEVILSERPATMIQVEPPIVRRTFLGVQLEDTDEGALVVSVVEDSPASAAGLQAEDVITAVNETNVTTARDLIEALSTLNPGDTVTLTFQRGEETQTADATLAEPPPIPVEIPPVEMPGNPGEMMPMNPGQMVPINPALIFGNGRLGVGVVNLTAENAAEYNVEATSGALVQEVSADSPAEAAGLQTGDIVTAVNEEPVDEERTLRDRLFAYEPGDTVSLTVTRAGEMLTVEATLAEQDMSVMPGMPYFFDGELPPGFELLPMPELPAEATDEAPRL